MITINGNPEHLVRPDGVYRTSVIQPTGSGYQPYPNAYAIAQRFAASDHLSGPGLGFWAKLKARFAGRATAKAVQAIVSAAMRAQAQPAPITSNASIPSAPGNSLPPSTSAPMYPGQSPDATQMSAMALYISSGFHPSFVPQVVEGRQEAAARVTAGTRITGVPAALALRVENYAQGRVGQAAWQAAAGRFYAMNKSRIG